MDHHAPGAVGPSRPVSILIVDDEILQLNLIGRIIRSYRPGYEVETAHQPAEALRLLKSGRFNALMTDVKMPGMSGIELIEAIRREKLEPLEIIILSGFDDFQYARSAISFDVLEYLLKPIDSQSLQKVLAKLDGKLAEDYARIRLQNAASGMTGRQCSMALFKMANGLSVTEDEGRIVASLVGARVRLMLWEGFADAQAAVAALPAPAYAEALDAERLLLFVPAPRGFAPCELQPRASLGGLSVLGLPCAPEELPLCWARLLELADTARRMGLGRLTESPPLSTDAFAEAIRSKEKARVTALAAELDMAAREGRVTLNRLERVAREEIGALIQAGALPRLYPQRKEELLTLLAERLGGCDSAEALAHTVAGLLESDDGEDVDAFERNVRIYLETHYAEGCSLDAISRAFHYSAAHFSRRFSTQFGATYTRYLADFRIAEACKLLLATDLSVQEVAARVGIRDVSYFIRIFNKKLNTSPAKYRMRGG